MKHLYLQTAFLGDLLLAVPCLKQIRYWSPQSEVTLICRKGYGPLMLELGLCDEVIEVDKKNKKDVSQVLKGQHFDTLFCPHESGTSHALVKKISADQKVGYRKFWNSSFFDIRVERNLKWPEAIRQLQLLAPLYESIATNLEAFNLKSTDVPHWAEMGMKQLVWPEKVIQKLADEKTRGFRVDHPYVCIAPGSVWETKRWTESSFSKVGIGMARQDLQTLIVGAPEERELCERLQKEIPNSYSLAGHLSVVESLMLLSKAKGLVCNDSGAMHMASIVDCPTVALFGPTVQDLGYRPWNPQSVVIENNELLCRPCGQHGSRKCPISTHACMVSLKPDRVLEATQLIFR